MELQDNLTGSAWPVPPVKEWTAVRVLIVTLYVLTFILIIVLNPLCLAVIRRVPNFQPSTKIFMMSLTVSDFGMGACVLLPYTLYVIVGYWAFGPFLCTLFRIAKYFFFCLCFLSLFLLTIDRYIAIAWCLHYERLVTVRRSKITILLILCAVTLVSVLGNVFNTPEPWDLKCGSADEQAALTNVIIGLALLGVLATVILYVHILVIARRQARRIAREALPAPVGNPHHAPQRHRPSTKSFTTVVIITAVLVTGWIPTIACLFLVYMGVKVPDYVDNIFYTLFYTCNWADAVIFYLKNKDFRETLHKMKTGCFRTLRQTLP